MRKLLSALALPALFFLASPSLKADTSFEAFLKGSNEVPPNISAGTGFANVTLNDAKTMLTISLSFGALLGGRRLRATFTPRPRQG